MSEFEYDSPNINYKGLYKNMKFPKYEFREYPKMIQDSTGKDVIVNDKREEMAIVATVMEAAGDDPVVQQKNKLLQLADEQAKALVQSEVEKKALKDRIEEGDKLLIEMSKKLQELESKMAAPNPASTTSSVLPTPPPAAPKIEPVVAEKKK